VTFLLDQSRELVTAALTVMAAALIAALIGLIVWRVVDEVRFLRRQRIISRYRPLVHALLAPEPSSEALQRLVATPVRHRSVLSDQLLAALRLTTGDVVPRLREAAAQLGLTARWTRSMHDRRWWVRAEAIRALGLIREEERVPALLESLDDPHEEVRAAAVDALGRIGDPRCGTALLARLRDDSRHQRARVLEAIRALGPSMIPVLLAHTDEHPADAAMTADVLGTVGGTAALERLLGWSGSDDAAVRAAALRAIGSIGVDDRSFFFALRGLDDTAADVRAMAARALGRSRRQSAVSWLAAHLDDEWLVAAHCATGLRGLGRPGAAALEARAGTGGPGGDLARQMLWELKTLRAGA
jgi:hypothetical protein